MQTSFANSPEINDAAPGPQLKLRVLWLVNLDYRQQIAHGGNLRLFHYGRELVSRGHEVYLVLMKPQKNEADGRALFVKQLERNRICTKTFEVDYHHPALLGKFAHLLFHPVLRNFCLRKHHEPVVNAIQQIIDSLAIDVFICSVRDLLFVVPRINPHAPTIIDWVDSYFLYHLRELRLRLRQRRFAQAARAFQFMAEAFIQERYFGRHASSNLTVSPVDKKFLDFANRLPHKNHVLQNGVETHSKNELPKIKGRLILTGRMDFPPNYEAAIWFIDHVFPLLKQHRDIHLVIAGANPVGQLLARANERIAVLGYVDDIRKEIGRSELYVAPLVSGGGFKNKVVEAISSGTFVIGTTLAAEFLPAEARGYIPTADSPHELAAAILNYLDEPEKFANNLEALRRMVAEQFSWPVRAQEFVDIIRPRTLGEGFVRS